MALKIHKVTIERNDKQIIRYVDTPYADCAERSAERYAQGTVLKVEAVDAVHLINCGNVEAKPVAQFRVGEKMMYNYGAAYTITEVVKETPKTVVLALDDNGTRYEQRFKKATLWGIGQ